VNPTKAVLLAREPTRDGDEVTPALVSVANRPLLRHGLDWLDNSGIREVAVLASDRIANHAWEVIGDGSDWSFDTNWLCEVPGESFGESLAALTGFIEDDPFILHLADSLADEPFPEILGDAEVDDLGAVVLTHGGEGAMAPVVDIRSRRAVRADRPAGVAVIGGGVVATTAAVDAQPGFELNQLASHVCGMGGSVEFRSTAGWWRFDTDAETVLEGNRFALGQLHGAPVEASMRDSVVQGPVSVHPSARIESSTVRGPAIIGPGACLTSAYIGPFTSVGANVVIEGAEVENSIIHADASVTHLNTRLEGSVVGAGARIFRDFRLPRAVRVSIGAGAQVAIT
jgi:glucose-1-phosphate thymidylyltransferase